MIAVEGVCTAFRHVEDRSVIMIRFRMLTKSSEYVHTIKLRERTVVMKDVRTLLGACIAREDSY